MIPNIILIAHYIAIIDLRNIISKQEMITYKCVTFIACIRKIRVTKCFTVSFLENYTF